MCKVIAFANQKGGVTKSTSTENIGIGLARLGKKVLLIDADGQGSLTASLGFRNPDSMEVTLPTILERIIEDEEVNRNEGLLVHEEGIYLMPCNIELSALEVSMSNVMRREYILKEYVDMQREYFDFILIDCMPSLGMITVNALTAADSVIIPVQASYLPIKGLEQLIKSISMVKKHLNPSLGVDGILISMVDERTRFSKDIIELLKENYGNATLADDKYNGKLPVHVRCILDEFANIGQIPKFDKLIATIRSREISASIILQSKAQLKAIYKDNAETIEGNCDTFLFLGGKEKSTLKDLADVLGKETIDTYNTSDTRGNNPSYGLNYQKLGRELMSQDRLALMDGGKCILQVRGVRPFFSDKVDITKHDMYNELSDANPKNAFDIAKYVENYGIPKKPKDTEFVELDTNEITFPDDLLNVAIEEVAASPLMNYWIILLPQRDSRVDPKKQ